MDHALHQRCEHSGGETQESKWISQKKYEIDQEPRKEKKGIKKRRTIYTKKWHVTSKK